MDEDKLVRLEQDAEQRCAEYAELQLRKQRITTELMRLQNEEYQRRRHRAMNPDTRNQNRYVLEQPRRCLESEMLFTSLGDDASLQEREALANERIQYYKDQIADLSSS